MDLIERKTFNNLDKTTERPPCEVVNVSAVIRKILSSNPSVTDSCLPLMFLQKYQIISENLPQSFFTNRS